MIAGKKNRNRGNRKLWRGTLWISLVFWWFSCVQVASSNWGIIWLLVDRGSLLRKVSDRQLTNENINFNSISNMIHGISSMIYGIGASIDISVRSVLRESRPGFPARGHDSESKRPLFGCICNACSNNTLWEESVIIMHQVHVLSLEICGSISVLANFEPPLKCVSLCFS